MKYYKSSLSIQEQIGYKEGLAFSLDNLARISNRMGQTDQAIAYAKRGLQISKEIGYPENIKRLAQILKVVLLNKSNYKEAYEMYELEIKMRDSINNQETQKAAIKKQMQYTYEKQEAVAKAEHKSELEKQQAVANEKSRKQKIVIFSVGIGLLLVVKY